MKKLIMLFVCCVLFVATGVTVYAESGVQVTDANGQTQVYNEMVTNIVLNGETKTLGKSPAVIVEGEVMAPPIAVFKKILGMSVTLNSNKKTVVLKTTEHTMELTANSKIAILDGEEMTLDIAPVFGTYMGTGTKSTLLPLKEISFKLPFKDKFLFVDNFCPSLKLRFEQIYKNIDNYDVFLIIGDKNSSNANELYNFVKKLNKKSYLISTIEELKMLEFDKNIKKVAVLSATSTSKEKVNNFIEILNKNW